MQKRSIDIRPTIHFIFFGNYFYGLCAVLLSIETCFQLGYSLNNWLFYLLIFSGTVIYYTKAYLTDGLAPTKNLPTIWYRDNHNKLELGQKIWICVFLITLYAILNKELELYFENNGAAWLLIFIFPCAALLYYGIFSHSLRSIGSIKPFCIGFIWAGAVTIYPILFKSVPLTEASAAKTSIEFLFINNFIFISILCIMFDIKDYATDYHAQLKTFVVKVGLRKTIFQILIPLSLFGFLINLFYGYTHQFSTQKLLFNLLPYILLIAVTYALRRRKSVLYYFIVIDGLMAIKAISGILGMI